MFLIYCFKKNVFYLLSKNVFYLLLKKRLKTLSLCLNELPGKLYLQVMAFVISFVRPRIIIVKFMRYFKVVKLFFIEF